MPPSTPPRMRPRARHEDTFLWAKSHQFVLRAFKLAGKIPKSEFPTLGLPLKQSAALIPPTLTEALQAVDISERVRLITATRSAIERSRYFLILAHDLGFADARALLEELDEVDRLLKGYATGTARKSA